MDLRVEYFYDDESGHWSFTVPSLHIVGGVNTKEEVEEEARAAILFTLVDDENEPVPDGHEIGYSHVTVEKATAPRPV